MLMDKRESIYVLLCLTGCLSRLLIQVYYSLAKFTHMNVLVFPAESTISDSFLAEIFNGMSHVSPTVSELLLQVLLYTQKAKLAFQ